MRDYSSVLFKLKLYMVLKQEVHQSVKHQTSDGSREISSNLHFDMFLLFKVYKSSPKKYRGVIFHDNEEWCKIWSKTGLRFENWLKEFGRFSSEHLNVLQLGLWWDLFVQSRKRMCLKIYRGAMCHDNCYVSLWNNCHTL